jgi:hypothetical protein
MNAATRAEQTHCSFFIVSLLSLLSGLGVMFPADVAAPKLQKRPDSPVILNEKPAVSKPASGRAPVSSNWQGAEAF